MRPSWAGADPWHGGGLSQRSRAALAESRSRWRGLSAQRCMPVHPPAIDRRDTRHLGIASASARTAVVRQPRHDRHAVVQAGLRVGQRRARSGQRRTWLPMPARYCALVSTWARRSPGNVSERALEKYRIPTRERVHPSVLQLEDLPLSCGRCSRAVGGPWLRLGTRWLGGHARGSKRQQREADEARGEQAMAHRPPEPGWVGERGSHDRGSGRTVNGCMSVSRTAPSEACAGRSSSEHCPGHVNAGRCDDRRPRGRRRASRATKGRLTPARGNSALARPECELL
jgi:hypothetical protein